MPPILASGRTWVASEVSRSNRTRRRGFVSQQQNHSDLWETNRAVNTGYEVGNTKNGVSSQSYMYKYIHDVIFIIFLKSCKFILGDITLGH